VEVAAGADVSGLEVTVTQQAGDLSGTVITAKNAPVSDFVVVLLAAALDYMEPGEETNPEFIEKLKSSATAVRVAESEKKTVTLKLIAQ